MTKVTLVNRPAREGVTFLIRLMSPPFRLTETGLLGQILLRHIGLLPVALKLTIKGPGRSFSLILYDALKEKYSPLSRLSSLMGKICSLSLDTFILFKPFMPLFDTFILYRMVSPTLPKVGFALASTTNLQKSDWQILSFGSDKGLKSVIDPPDSVSGSEHIP